MTSAVLDGQLDLLSLLDDVEEEIVERLGEPIFEPVVSEGQTRFEIDLPKPPYRVPLMTEIAEVAPNGYSLVSTFSGCGGSCLGFRMAGFRTLLASEFVPAAADTYVANHPGVPVAVSDVRDLEPELILARLGLRRGELDVLEGSPPCSSFSMAGKREDGWGEVKKYSDVMQRTDDLFFEFVRLVDGLLPRVVVAENVPGLLAGDAVDYFNEVSRRLDDLGYVLWADVLNAAWFGVPQNRRRVIIVAVRRDLGVQPAFPRRLPYGYSIRDAIGLTGGEKVVGGSGSVRGSRGAAFDGDEPMPTVLSQAGRWGSDQFVVERNEDEFPGLPEGSLIGTRIGGENALVSSDGPAPTITANGIGGRSNRGENDSQMVHLPGLPDGTILRMDGADVEPVRSVDLPAPTITADGISGRYVGGSKAHGYLESPSPEPDSNLPGVSGDAELVYRGQNSGAPWGERRRSLDEPSPTISADGLAGAARHQALIEEPEGSIEHDARDTAPTARARKIAHGEFADEDEAATLEGYAVGAEWDLLRPGESSKKYFNLVRPDPEQPLPTVTAQGVGSTSGAPGGVASVTHPTEKRKFTVAELKRLCSFPDDFILTGSYGQQWERLGRAVPPMMMKAIAETVRDEILGKADAVARGDGA